MSTKDSAGTVVSDDQLFKGELTDKRILSELENGEAISETELPAIVVSDEDNRRVLRKIDMVLIPLTMVAYTLQYIDRSAMSYAVVFSFEADAHLTSNDYSWLGSCYYLGYLFFEFPGSWIMQRLPLGRTLGIMIVLWGGILMCMAAPRNFAGMAAVRTLLGMAESLVTPGFVLLVSRFYKREEQPLRVGYWYSALNIGGFLGSLISYGMGHVNVDGIPNWAWIFLINGAITVIFGFVFFFYCPENPQSARFLSVSDRRIALERVRGNHESLHSKHFKWYQFREAITPWKDPQGWLYVIIVFTISIPSGGLGNFSKLVLKGYGFTSFQTILMSLPAITLGYAFSMSGSYIARKVPNSRCYVMAAYIIPCLVGIVIQYKATRTGVLLFGYFLLGSYLASLGLAFAGPGANVAGYTKKITVNGMVFISYATAEIITPHFWSATEIPAYRSGIFSCLVCFAVAPFLILTLRLWYTLENKRRDRIQAENGYEEGDEYGDFADLTDRENLSFRYAL